MYASSLLRSVLRGCCVYRKCYFPTRLKLKRVRADSSFCLFRGIDQKKGKKMTIPAFRKDYGNLSTLRSLCKQGKVIELC